MRRVAIGSCDVARIARPRLVRKNRNSTTAMAARTPRITSCWGNTMAPKKNSGSVPAIGSRMRGSASPSTSWREITARAIPAVATRRMTRDAPCRGRTTTRSSNTPNRAPATTPPSSAKKIGTPRSTSAHAPNAATVPNSPWAKLKTRAPL
jgi:hypothetical protein